MADPQSGQHKRVKITAVGDKVEGRTDLLHIQTNASKVWPVLVDGKSFHVSLRDTGSMEELDRLQPAVYRDTDCFLLCYSENVRESFDAVESKWCQEITRICPNVPFILVAYKSGNSGGADAKAVSGVEGQKLKQKIDASAYVEFSTESDVDSVLCEAVRAILTHTPAVQQVQSSPGYVDDADSGPSRGCCTCFKGLFKAKDSSYSFQ